MSDVGRGSGRRRVVRIAVGAAFTAAMAAVAAFSLSHEALDAAVRSISVGPALVALGTYVALTAARAARFLLTGARFSFGTAFGVTAVHAAMLRVLPLRSGELAYAALLDRTGAGTFGGGLAAILMIRILDFAAVLPLSALVLGLGLAGSPNGLAAAVAAAVAVACSVAFFLLGPASRAVHRVLSERAAEGFAARAARAMAATCDLPAPRRFALLASTLVVWALVLAWFVITLDACGLRLSLAQSLVAGVLGIAGSVLPISLVGTFGPMEGGIGLGLAAAGHSPQAAAAGAVVVSAVTFAANWAVALPAWLALLATGALGRKGR